MPKKIKLSEIPHLLTLSTEKKYKLEGFVSYIQLAQTRTQSNVALQRRNQVDHYTAVLLHENGQWTEIDDTTATETAIKNKSVVPHLLVYSELMN